MTNAMRIEAKTLTPDQAAQLAGVLMRFALDSGDKKATRRLQRFELTLTQDEDLELALDGLIEGDGCPVR